MRLIKRWKLFKSQMMQTFRSVVALFTNNFFFKKDEYDYYCGYSDTVEENELGACLIAMFDGRQIHCGLTDRFKGICTTYEFSKDFNIPFYIHFISPFDLSDYLLPNGYDWKVDRGKVKYGKRISVPVFLNDWQSNTSFHKLYLKQVIKRNPNKQIHVYSDSTYYIKRYVNDFHFLFKPCGSLLSAIDQCLAEIGSGKYCAMAFRFLMLLGDFKEEHAKFPTLEDAGQQELMEKCEQQILKLRTELGINSKILLTADSKKFIDYMNRYDFIYVVPGEIAHVDNSHETNRQIYMKTFLDMFMLSKAEVIYQLHTGDMYRNSAFARQAALLGRKRYVQIEF